MKSLHGGKEEDTFLCDSVGRVEPRGKGYRQTLGRHRYIDI